MRPQIVLFGDSITEQSFRLGGWGASLADTYSRKVDILNRGYGGYNTRWALFLLHHLFPLSTRLVVRDKRRGTVHFVVHQWDSTMDAPMPPVAATIFFGANDAALLGRTSERQHVPLEEYKENLRRIIQHFKKCSPSMLLLLITPPPVDEAGRFGHARSMYGDKAMQLPERTNEVAGEYAKQCVELARELGLPSINLWSKMQETEGWQIKFLSDGLHLTPEGNAIVYQEVVKVLNETSLSATKMSSDVPHHSEIDGQNPEKAFKLQCPAI
ncbi:GDSL esterase/lipase At5g62930 isoform X1 [Lycium barbarum]|uniref:GDSL esterase/lipase At5g62930 isoform X1 n=1 Tax=Lycium barbarum TaxID=112863 RepID=UPI00293E20C3|nr:GDSL esterase/lipase At5g62930 isoform X1 [Lycium barbarum]